VANRCLCCEHSLIAVFVLSFLSLACSHATQVYCCLPPGCLRSCFLLLFHTGLLLLLFFPAACTLRPTGSAVGVVGVAAAGFGGGDATIVGVVAWQRCWCCCFLAAASAALPMFFVAFAVLPLSAAAFGVLPFLLAAVSAFLCCFGWRRIAPIVVCCLGFGVAAVFGGGIVSVMLPLVFLAAASVAPLLLLLAAALALLPLLFVVSWQRCWHCCLCSWQHHIGGSILGGVLGGIVLLPLIGSNMLLYSCSDPGQEAIINLNKPFIS